MKTVPVPTDEDLTTAAKNRHDSRREQSLERGREPGPTWEQLHDVEREDEISKMRAAHAAGPRVAAALGLRMYSQQVVVPEVGQTVIYKGWPAVVTLTCDSADQYSEPFQAQTALPSLSDELQVHLHVLSALGPYPVYGVKHGGEGWLWPDEAADERAKQQARDAIWRERRGPA